MAQPAVLPKKNNFTGQRKCLQRPLYGVFFNRRLIIEAIWISHQSTDKSGSTIASCELIQSLAYGYFLWKALHKKRGRIRGGGACIFSSLASSINRFCDLLSTLISLTFGSENKTDGDSEMRSLAILQHHRSSNKV